MFLQAFVAKVGWQNLHYSLTYYQERGVAWSSMDGPQGAYTEASVQELLNEATHV
jgi:hypothetical protein